MARWVHLLDVEVNSEGTESNGSNTDSLCPGLSLEYECWQGVNENGPLRERDAHTHAIQFPVYVYMCAFLSPLSLLDLWPHL